MRRHSVVWKEFPRLVCQVPGFDSHTQSLQIISDSDTSVRIRTIDSWTELQAMFFLHRRENVKRKHSEDNKDMQLKVLKREEIAE